MSVAVSIVSFNTKELLRRSLNDVFSQKKIEKLDVWVVDNDSSDGSTQMIKKKFPNVHLIKSKHNLGFAKGHNLALKKINSDFTILLNPDTQIPADAISKMVEFMSNSQNCGVSSCKILGFDGKLQPNGGDLPTLVPLLNWLFNLEFFGNFPNFHRLDENYYSKIRKVGWVSGTFMMIRQNVFKKIGFLNEDYFMYVEDVEFCFKAQRAGFEVMINPSVVIRHVSGASSKDPRLRQWSGEIEGLIYFYNKFYGHFAGVVLKIFIYLTTVARIVAFSSIGKTQVAKTYGKILLTI